MKKRTKMIGIGISTGVAAAAVGIWAWGTMQYKVSDTSNENVASNVHFSGNYVEAVPVEEQEEIAEDDFITMDDGPHYDIGSYPDLGVDHAALKAQNPDYKGWLYVPSLEISYPVVRGTDNDYYLHHTFEGAESTAGCIFIDSGCAKDMGDYNTIFYGHNMKNGSMFGSFKKLQANPDMMDDDPYIYYYTEDGVYAYRVYSFHQALPKSNYFSYSVTQQKYWDYVDLALSDRLKDMNTVVDKKKNSITLSTCKGSGAGKQRFLIHGINIGYYKPV